MNIYCANALGVTVQCSVKSAPISFLVYVCDMVVNGKLSQIFNFIITNTTNTSLYRIH